MGYEVWRQIEKNWGGMVVIEMDAGFIAYQAK